MIPHRYLVVKDTSADSENVAAIAEPDTSLSMPEHALVVEDSLVIALDMQKKLKALGVQNVAVAGTLAAARRSVEGREPGLAVFDVHLGNETSFDLIRQLSVKGIPAIIVSGYGEDVDIPDEIKHVPVLTKPVTGQDLITTLAQIL